MGATGIYFDGTAAEARNFMIEEIVKNHILREGVYNLVDYSIAKDDLDGTNEIYAAVHYVKENVIIAVVVLYTFDKKDKEIVFRDYDEFSFPYHANCAEKILRQLSPISELEKAFNFEKVDYEMAQKWRNACRAVIAEKKKISLSALKKKEKSRGAFQVKFQNSEGEHALTFSSVADFKTRGKILKLGNVNLICSCADTARKSLEGLKKAFVEGAAGFNLYNMTAYGEEKQLALF